MEKIRGISKEDLRMPSLSNNENDFKGSEIDLERTKNFLQEFGENGSFILHSFIHDKEKEKILGLKDIVGREEASSLFEKYSDLIDFSSKILEKNNININTKEAELIMSDIVGKAKKIVIASYDYNKIMKEFPGKELEDKGPLHALKILGPDALVLYKEFLDVYFNGKNEERLSELVEQASKFEDGLLLNGEYYKQNNLNFSVLTTLAFEAILLSQIKKEKKINHEDPAETDKFYKNYIRLNEEADETTADSLRERIRIYQFLKEINPKGKILDAGCGDGARITEFIARFLKKENNHSQIVAIDQSQDNFKGRLGVEYKKGNITDMRELFPDKSLDCILNNWSVVNDLTKREEQLATISEYARTLKEGGCLYLDVPFLEGGHGSWFFKAQLFNDRNKDLPFGTIEERIGSNKIKKRFFIYPYLELVNMLENNDLEVLNKIKTLELENSYIQGSSGTDGFKDPFTKPYWRTRGDDSKPRITIIARKKS